MLGFTRTQLVIAAVTAALAVAATIILNATNAAPNVAALTLLLVVVGAGIALGMADQERGAHR